MQEHTSPAVEDPFLGSESYNRVTKRAEMNIAGAYLAGTDTRGVRRALQGLFGARIGTDTVSRA